MWKKPMLSGYNLATVIITYRKVVNLNVGNDHITHFYCSANFSPECWFAFTGATSTFPNLNPCCIYSSSDVTHVWWVTSNFTQACKTGVWAAGLTLISESYRGQIEFDFQFLLHILFLLLPLFLISRQWWSVLYVTLTGQRGAWTFGQTLFWVCL